MLQRCARRSARAAAFCCAVAGVPLATAPLVAQEPAATLTLEEALQLARKNNPDFLAQANDEAVADWAVRESYASLLPGASASTSLGWQDAGTARFGGILTGADVGLSSSTSYYSSSYSLGLNYQLSGAKLLAPSREKASRRATEANIAAAGATLDANVTTEYLMVLQAQDGVELARQELARAEENLRYAQARVRVGAATDIEAQQAEVERGRAQVALLQAENLVRTERLRLMEMLGVELDRDIRLTTTFSVGDVPWTENELIAMAIESHPQLRAARATVRSAETGVKMARSAYLPSLSMSAGWSGFTRQAGNEDFLIEQTRDQIASQAQNCQLMNSISSGLSSPLPGRPVDCSTFVLTHQQEARIRSGNNVFPFDFSKEPLSVSLQLSLPIFQGLSRERQVEEARSLAADARYQERSAELRLRREVGTAYLNVVTARRSYDLEQRNRQLADDQLRLARERYRVGVASFLELQEAETVKARADRAYLQAVYAFHQGLAALEAAVGRPLR